ncbi:UNVERIFIED_CONTAM: hypothetical protein GTU68_026393 [Idotea baltica]|nr:hypothetical protein [Idotea baltica]
MIRLVDAFYIVNCNTNYVTLQKNHNKNLLSQLFIKYLKYGKQNTRSQKSRAEVSGGGIKPRRQKGTGRARVGSIRSPLFVKGGRIFPLKYYKYYEKLNKKMYQHGFNLIISQCLSMQRCYIMIPVHLSYSSTTFILLFLVKNKFDKCLLIVDWDEISYPYFFSLKNLRNVTICDINSLNPIKLLVFKKIIYSFSAFKKLFCI